MKARLDHICWFQSRICYFVKSVLCLAFKRTVFRPCWHELKRVPFLAQIFFQDEVNLHDWSWKRARFQLHVNKALTWVFLVQIFIWLQTFSIWPIGSTPVSKHKPCLKQPQIHKKNGISWKKTQIWANLPSCSYFNFISFKKVSNWAIFFRADCKQDIFLKGLFITGSVEI